MNETHSGLIIETVNRIIVSKALATNSHLISFDTKHN